MDEPFFPPTGKQVVPLTNLHDEDDLTIIARPDLLKKALLVCAQKKRASTAVLQGEFEIGYEDAVNLLDKMTVLGWIGEANGDRPRPLLNLAFETLAIWDAQEKLKESAGEGKRDELFEEALRICVEMQRASTSVLQRRLRIGYGRSAAILDQFEREGFIGQADGARPRPVLGRAFEMVAKWDDEKKRLLRRS
jgi:DNA segregation ATPase FtsK/SpoIIIE-like protein